MKRLKLCGDTAVWIVTEPSAVRQDGYDLPLCKRHFELYMNDVKGAGRYPRRPAHKELCRIGVGNVSVRKPTVH